MTWQELAGDPAIAAMDDAEFAEFWQALGIVVRIRARHAKPVATLGRDPASTIAARADLAPRRGIPTGFRQTGDPS